VEILRGVYPETVEILRYTQDDTMRRAQNDRERAQSDSAERVQDDRRTGLERQVRLTTGHSKRLVVNSSIRNRNINEADK